MNLLRDGRLPFPQPEVLVGITPTRCPSMGSSVGSQSPTYPRLWREVHKSIFPWNKAQLGFRYRVLCRAWLVSGYIMLSLAPPSPPPPPPPKKKSPVWCCGWCISPLLEGFSADKQTHIQDFPGASRTHRWFQDFLAVYSTSKMAVLNFKF